MNRRPSPLLLVFAAVFLLVGGWLLHDLGHSAPRPLSPPAGSLKATVCTAAMEVSLEGCATSATSATSATVKPARNYSHASPR